MCRYALVLLAGFLVVACQSQAPPDQRLARFVDEVMFGGNIDDHVAKDNRVVRWTGNLLVEVTGTNAGKYRPRIAAQLEKFSKLSGIHAQITYISSSPDVKITLSKNEIFLINREYVPCFAGVRTKSGRIVAAEIVISMADPEEFDHCLNHELMHAFGLRFHSGIVRSTMSPVHRAAHLTPWDELALRVLYDTRLQLGAGRTDVAPVIHEIVSEIIAGS